MKTAKASRKKIAHSAKAKMKMKAAKRKAPRMKTRRAIAMKKKPARAVHMPPKARAASKVSKVTPISDRLENRVFNDAREYDRRVFVRFDGPGKEMVRQAAGEIGLSPYIAHFAAEAAKAGKKVVATPVTTKETGVFARFESPAIKKMVAKAASDCGISLSAYASYFAVEAAKADRKMPMQKAAVAS
jgi:hypothetical protein